MERRMILLLEEAEKALERLGADDVPGIIAKARDAKMDSVELVAKDLGDGGFQVTLEEPTGAIVALMLPGWVQPQVAIPGATRTGALHITLAYVGEAKDLTFQQQRDLIGTVGQVAMRHRPLTGVLSGTGRFAMADGSDEPYWVGADIEGLQELHDDLVTALTAAGFTPGDHGVYVPHVTVAYLPAGTPSPALDFQPLSVSFDEMTVLIAGQHVDIEFNEQYPGQDDMDVDEPARGWVPQALTKAVEVDDEQRYTLAPWYPPGMLDAHGEWSDSKEVEKAFHEYMSLPDPHIRFQHNKEIIAGRRVDGVVWPFEVTVPLTKADGTRTEHTFPAGTPFLGTVWEKWSWPLVKEGKITGYSIGGTAKRMMVDLPEDEANAAIAKAKDTE